MTVVYFPEPKSKRDPNRAAGSLLLAQVKHLREAEQSLPPHYRNLIFSQSGIFSHAIETESEAARYIRAVTEAIHAAHDDAARARSRVKKAPKRREVITIAAEADEAAERKARSRSKAKNTAKKKSGAKRRKR